MDTKTEDAVMDLVDMYEPLINKLATKYMRLPRITREDLCQEGRLAAYNAILTYDENFGTSLKTWIYRCVQNAMIAYFQANMYELHSTAYFQKQDLETIKEQEHRLIALDKDLGDGLKLADTIKGPRSTLDIIIKEEEDRLLEKEINSLSPVERFILDNSKIFCGEMSLEQIGDALKVTKQRVSQKLKNIINKIRVNLEEVA